jgi:hypothetical protein
MDVKQFNTNVKTIARSGKKLDVLVHTTAVAGLLLVQADSNTTRMNQLLVALPNGYRREAFKLWVSAHSPIKWNSEGEIKLVKPDAKSFRPFNIEAADATPFWAFSEENKVIKTLSLDLILAMLKREEDKLAKADAEGNIKDDEGNVTYKVKGNVIDIKTRLAAMRVAGNGGAVAAAVAAA